MVETTAQAGWPGPGGVQSGAFVLKHDPLLLRFLLLSFPSFLSSISSLLPSLPPPLSLLLLAGSFLPSKRLNIVGLQLP